MRRQEPAELSEPSQPLRGWRSVLAGSALAVLMVPQLPEALGLKRRAANEGGGERYIYRYLSIHLCRHILPKRGEI